MALNDLMIPIPQKHRCGTKLERKEVPVDKKVLTTNRYEADYCPRCKVYKYNKQESKDPKIIGDFITKLQARTNLQTLGSIYCITHLKKIAKAKQ